MPGRLVQISLGRAAASRAAQEVPTPIGANLLVFLDVQETVGEIDRVPRPRRSRDGRDGPRAGRLVVPGDGTRRPRRGLAEGVDKLMRQNVRAPAIDPGNPNLVGVSSVRGTEAGPVIVDILVTKDDEYLHAAVCGPLLEIPHGAPILIDHRSWDRGRTEMAGTTDRGDELIPVPLPIPGAQHPEIARRQIELVEAQEDAVLGEELEGSVDLVDRGSDASPVVPPRSGEDKSRDRARTSRIDRDSLWVAVVGRWDPVDVAWVTGTLYLFTVDDWWWRIPRVVTVILILFGRSLLFIVQLFVRVDDVRRPLLYRGDIVLELENPFVWVGHA